ncbi:MAG: type II toxin-antitoxin system RelE/ParE family toxin [Planctomycetes bacterium]|nr:type II toxin-antitoxin system RelE/ParE family toxin [Planctomycetota bacterium]
MTTRVVVTPEAARQVRTINGWWRRERPAAPDLFAQEVAAAFALLNGAPLAGRHYPHPTVSDVRRILLRSSRYHVYYRIHQRDVIILAVWGAVRGTGPELR